MVLIRVAKLLSFGKLVMFLPCRSKDFLLNASPDSVKNSFEANGRYPISVLPQHRIVPLHKNVQEIEGKSPDIRESFEGTANTGILI